MKTLLAVDGSDNSYEAVRALKYLQRADELTILHVVDVPKPAYPMMVPEVAHELYAELEHSMKEDGSKLLDRVQSLLPLHAGPVTKRLEVGMPAEVIVTAAETGQVDLVVMGARGLGPFKERLFGSISHRVLTLAPCAKLIVKGALRDIKEILLPVQGQYDAAAAVRFMQKNPFKEPINVTLLTVLPSTRPPWPVDPSAAEKLEAQALQHARDFIEDTAAKLRTMGHSVRGTSVLGTPAPMIIHEAEKVRPDVIMMGSRGRQGFTRFVLGSVSHAVLHHAACAVLVFE
ncbi:MAG TPA: universal stress protein [Nitrospiraceae bacterium]|jgi:nucleotide-binding universal stress UspA family protein|nr:universal stress protein [Nitrospiraceae bacterium]